MQTQRPHPAQLGMTIIELMVAVMVLAVAIAAVIGTIANLDSMRRDTSDTQRANQVAEFMAQTLQGANWADLNDQSKPAAYLTYARWPDADASGTIEDDTNCLGDEPTAANRLPFTTGLVDLRVYLEYYRATTATDDTGNTLQSGTNYCFAGLLQGSLTRTAGAGGEVWTIDPTDGDPSRGQEMLSGMALVERNGNSFRIPQIGIKAVDANGDGTTDAIEPILLPAASTLASLSGTTIGVNDPVAARIIVSWKDRNFPAAPGQPRRQFTLITGVKR